MEKLPGHLVIYVYGNPSLSNESAVKLKEMWAGMGKIESGDCLFLSGKVTSASELDGCKTISYDLSIRSDFTGTTNAVITRVDRNIEILNSNIEDMSFLNLTERGPDWIPWKNSITIANNPKLCTSDFEKMLETLDPPPVYTIKNNRDKAVCENERKASMTTTLAWNSSAYQHIFAALCLVAAATIFAVL